MWTEERKKVEKAIQELVHLSQLARAKRTARGNAVACAYEHAILILQRQFNEPGQGL